MIFYKYFNSVIITILQIVLIFLPCAVCADIPVIKTNHSILRPLSNAEKKEISVNIPRLSDLVVRISNGGANETQVHRLVEFLNDKRVLKQLGTAENGRKILDIVLDNYEGLRRHGVFDEGLCRRVIKAGGFYAIEKSYAAHEAFIRSGNELAEPMLILCARAVSGYETDNPEEKAVIEKIANDTFSSYEPAAKRAAVALGRYREYNDESKIKELDEKIARNTRIIESNNKALAMEKKLKGEKGANQEWCAKTQKQIEAGETANKSLEQARGVLIERQKKAKNIDLKPCDAVSSSYAVALRLILSSPSLDAPKAKEYYDKFMNSDVKDLCTALAIANRPDMRYGALTRQQVESQLAELLTYEARYQETGRVVAGQMQALSEMAEAELFAPQDQNDSLVATVSSQLVALCRAKDNNTSWRRQPNDARLSFLTAVAIQRKTDTAVRVEIRKTLYDKVFLHWLNERTSWDTTGRLDISVGALVISMCDILRAPKEEGDIRRRAGIAYYLVRKIEACHHQIDPKTNILDRIFEMLDILKVGVPPTVKVAQNEVYDLRRGVVQALGVMTASQV